MLPDSLAPEKNAVAKNVAELRDLLENQFAMKYVVASLRDIHLLPGGAIRVHGDVIPFTQKFLEDIAAYIAMPTSYAYEIDFQLFSHNFLERKGIKDQAVRICIVAGRAVALARGEHRPARTLDIVDGLPAAGLGSWKLQKALLSDRGVQIDLLSNEVAVEPTPGDVVRAGIRITNSECDGPALKAAVYTERLICFNGAVMKDNVGVVRWNYDKRVTYLSSIAKFTSSLGQLRDKQDELKNIYSKAIGRPVEEEELARLWRRIRTAGGLTPERTDLILGLSDQDRRTLIASVNERRAANQPTAPSHWDVFTIHNRITEAAQSLPFGARSRLERIGGEVLSYRLSN